MNDTLTIETPNSEHSKEEYLENLPLQDRENLLKVAGIFKEHLRQEGKEGYLIAVGGTLTKQLPRPDIDIVVMIQDPSKKLVRGNFTDFYQYMKANFTQLKEFINQVTDRDTDFEVIQIYDPEIDDLDSPGILRHDGSITITNKQHPGMLLQFINAPYKDDFQTAERRPFAVIEKV